MLGYSLLLMLLQVLINGRLTVRRRLDKEPRWLLVRASRTAVSFGAPTAKHGSDLEMERKFNAQAYIENSISLTTIHQNGRKIEWAYQMFVTYGLEGAAASSASWWEQTQAGLARVAVLLSLLACLTARFLCCYQVLAKKSTVKGLLLPTESTKNCASRRLIRQSRRFSPSVPLTAR